jgi:regulator of protease activity HflC (stomatin/prohibitin superfamily)
VDSFERIIAKKDVIGRLGRLVAFLGPGLSFVIPFT